MGMAWITAKTMNALDILVVTVQTSIPFYGLLGLSFVFILLSFFPVVFCFTLSVLEI